MAKNAKTITPERKANQEKEVNIERRLRAEADAKVAKLESEVTRLKGVIDENAKLIVELAEAKKK